MTDDDFGSLKKVISDAENMKYYAEPYDDNGVTRWINWSLKFNVIEEFMHFPFKNIKIYISVNL